MKRLYVLGVALAAGLWLSCGVAHAGGGPSVTINEIRIDQPSADNDEYFELAGAEGTSLDGLTYVVIGDGTGGSGTIEAVIDLTGNSIAAGSGGFFLAAESSFSLGGTVDLTTSINFENSDNLTHLLVTGFSGSNGDDLDTDDDCVLDVTPWTGVVDAIAMIEEDNPPGGTECHYGPPTVGPDGSFVPGHVFRCADGSGDWVIGEFDPANLDDTPRAANACPTVSVTINEIRIDQPSADNDEYFELVGAEGDSLDGLTYLVIGDGTGGSGTIEAVVDLTGNSIAAGSGGYFLAAEGSFTLGGTVDLTTTLNFENSDNVTHLVVRDFTGANGDDLDTDDDCVLDVTPWGEIVDSIALIEEDNPPGSTECHYGPPTVGPDGSFVPGHVKRCLDTDGAFIPGEFDPTAGDDTPRAPNNCPVDIYINEIRIDNSGDDFDEYFEIAAAEGTSLDDLWYIVIGDDTPEQGIIECVVPLTGNTVAAGSGGYFLCAEDTFTLGGVTPDLIVDSVSNVLNFENSDNVTHLLVRGFTGMLGDDLDVEDDCILDSTPWTEIVDEVVLKESDPPDCFYSTVVVGPDGSFVPGHVFRCGDGPGDWGIGSFTLGADDTPRAANPADLSIVGQPNSKIGFVGEATSFTVTTNGGGDLFFQWRKDTVDLADGGNISGANTATLTIDPVAMGDEGSYDCLIFSACGNLTSDAATLTVAEAPEVTINEIRIDESGTDNNEYFELVGAPGTSLDGVTYIVIGDDTPEQGIIEAVIPLTGLSIPADGHFLAVEDTFSLACGDVADLVLPSATNGINFENSDNVTHLLVVNFSGFDGQDLDADDDCVLDIEPWDLVLDDLALKESDPPDCFYSANVIGPDGTFVPGHVYRCPSGTGAFQFGNFSPLCSDAESPGFVNPPCVTAQPADAEVCEGDPVSFSVTGDGIGTLLYQWRLDGIDLVDDSRISGATTDTLSIDPVYASDAGDYTCVVTDDNSSQESASAELTVDPLYDVRVGNVNAGAGSPVAVLFVNGSAGNGPERNLSIDPNVDGFEVVIQSPPSRTEAKYAVYIWFDTPTKDTQEILPQSAGEIGMPTPLTGNSPQPFWIANNLKPALGTTFWFNPFTPIEKAPYVLADYDAPLPRGDKSFYIQGIIQDDDAPNGKASVTNGIFVTVGSLNP